MNWRHFQAFVWLRWRLLANQWRRAGAFNAALMVVVSVAALASVIPLFLGGFALAVYAIPKAAPAHLMYAWDGLIGAFLLFWMIGLVTELQRNDPLSLSKFLHLPVSVNGAFLLNYLSSLLRLSLLFFGPLMAAFALALIYVKGWEQWPVVPLLAAFLLMVTALTYQFQGWLALLMSNPRRRRTVVVAMTMGVVLVAQLPNLLNLYAPWRSRPDADRATADLAKMGELRQALQVKEINLEDFTRQIKQINERSVADAERVRSEDAARLEKAVRIGNTALPVGWLPLGVMSAAEGRVAPALLGLLGMTLIGSVSLWRAYRTTIAVFQGQGSNRKGRMPVAREAVARHPGRLLIEARIPGLSEPVSAIALGGFWSLVRSPEAKIALLSPLILCVVFGSMLVQRRQDIPISFRPLIGIGAMVSVLFGLLQLMGNQFGVDRDGFRVFVLCAAPRRDILLGKNLTCAPVALGLSAILLAIVQVLAPMRVDHALSMVPQFVSMYLLFCVLANLLSIYSPFYNAAGTLKPANPKLTTILLQLALFLLLFPLCQGITMIPIGAEAALNALGWASGVPVCLLLAVAECVAIVFFYRASLGWLGSELQAREQRILETVTNRGV